MLLAVQVEKGGAATEELSTTIEDLRNVVQPTKAWTLFLRIRPIVG